MHFTDKCYNTKDCDCKPIVAQIVADIQVCIDIIAKLTGTIDIKLSVIVKLIVSIIVVSGRRVWVTKLYPDYCIITQKISTACGKWVVKLGLSVYLSIFASIDAILVALVNVLVKLSVSILLQIKLA